MIEGPALEGGSDPAVEDIGAVRPPGGDDESLSFGGHGGHVQDHGSALDELDSDREGLFPLFNEGGPFDVSLIQHGLALHGHLDGVGAADGRFVDSKGSQLAGSAREVGDLAVDADLGHLLGFELFLLLQFLRQFLFFWGGSMDSPAQDQGRQTEKEVEAAAPLFHLSAQE